MSNTFKQNPAYLSFGRSPIQVLAGPNIARLWWSNVYRYVQHFLTAPGILVIWVVIHPSTIRVHGDCLCWSNRYRYVQHLRTEPGILVIWVVPHLCTNRAYVARLWWSNVYRYVQHLQTEPSILVIWVVPHLCTNRARRWLTSVIKRRLVCPSLSNSTCNTCHLGGHPSKYYPGLTVIDFGDQIDTGISHGASKARYG
jgi:hypothetical protein